MKVVVIGGTRFIGPFVIRELTVSNHEVAVFHRGETVAELPDGVTEILGDRKRLSDYTEDFRKFAPDVVVDMISLNENDATGLIETFRGIASRAVVISSMDVYRAYDIVRGLRPGPPDPTPLTEESPLRERLYPYDHPVVEDYEKILVEKAAMSDPELQATILRLPAVYGPGDYQRRIYQYLKRMDDGRPTILLEENLADWRWTMGYVEDVAHAISLAVTDERAAGRIYNVGEPDALTQTEVIQTIADITGWKGEILPAPTELLPEHLRVGLENTGQDFTVSSELIRDELGYREYFTREEAFRKTIRWDRENPPPDLPTPSDYTSEDEAISKIRQCRNMDIRNLRESDHARIIPVVDGWWGRPMTHNLPRLFFRHFEDTSFVVEEDGELVAFLVGFVSQSRANEAYIHFVGVAPEYRGSGVARRLYERFFEGVRGCGCERVRCITSPVNEGSISFHRRMGFDAEICPDYDGDGKPKVVFSKNL